MGFGPFFVHLGHLVTGLETLIRTPKSAAGVPAPWPIAPAPGWFTHRLDEDWSITAWCALGGEWIFRESTSDKKRIVHIAPTCAPERRASIVERLSQPPSLLAAGEVFSFCDSLFVIPEESFVMNSYRCHVAGREPLGVFLGFRGHARQYPEVITPSIYRAHNKPDDESAGRYRRRVRVAANVVKQGVFEQENVVLTNVQARGVLQHYGIIGSTDVLDLSYDVNVAKWFALNVWDRAAGCYRQKSFDEHQDADKAHDEVSLVYTVVVRQIATQVDPSNVAELEKFGRLTLRGRGGEPVAEPLASLPARNVFPLWSTRAERQAGFGLLGVGPRDDDAWGSVLGIYEHCFHPTFFPDGWDRIGGASLTLGGRTYQWDENTSALSHHTLPDDDDCIRWIRANVVDLETRLNL
ncbi:MAG: FRG domain-containing protein [bacterium]